MPVCAQDYPGDDGIALLFVALTALKYQPSKKGSFSRRPGYISGGSWVCKFHIG